MEKQSTSKASRTSNEPTAASILGIKGQLRFHPHGSTQKPHVVLRQVDISEDTDDEGESSTIYFSLFAQKRIEVKPGKEILLAVAAPDGKLLDTPVIFAGRLRGEDTTPERIIPPPAQAEPILSSSPCTLPPKMRKTWSKRTTTQHVASASILSRTYTSIGIQAVTPEAPVADAVDASPVTAPRPLHTERSLSPMELDSLPSSPALSSPTPLPDVTRPTSVRTNSTSFSPPGLWISTPPLHDKALPPEDAITSLQLSPDSDDIPGLSSDSVPHRSPTPKPPLNDGSNQVQQHDSSAYEPAVSLNPPADEPTKEAEPIFTAKGVDIPSQTQSEDLMNAAPAARYVPRRKIVPNPFVSGGLLTDFVGSPAAKSPVSSSASSPRDGTAGVDTDVSEKKTSPDEPSTQTIPPTSQNSSGVNGTETSKSPDHGIRPLTPSAPQRRPRSPEVTASATSSRVKMEDIPPIPAPSPGSSAPQNHPKLPPAMPPFPPSRYPPPIMPPFPPQHPPSIPGRWSNGPTPPHPPGHPPYVPATSFSNPLGIRPAMPSTARVWQPDQYVPSAPPPPVQQPPSASKKPLPIGSGWPYNRQANGGRRTSLKPANNAPIFQPATSLSSPQALSPTGTPQPSSGTLTPSLYQTPHTPTVEANGATATASSSQSDAISLTPFMNGHVRSDIEHLLAAINPNSLPVRSDGSVHQPYPVHSNTPLPPNESASSSGSIPSWMSGQGLKRAGSPVPQANSPDSRKQKSFKWSTSETVHVLQLQGDADVGIRNISHSSDGSLCAVSCNDKSVRILSTKTRTELAKLAHNMPVISVAWMDRDAGVVTLGDNGIVSTWTRSAGNKWQWAKIFDASAGDRRNDESPGSLAFGKDKIAIAYPRTGVKVWLFIKGTWLPQRSILRQNVTAIKFVEDNEALIGGTTDGVLWYCQVPNGTLRAYAFMKTKVYALDTDPKSSHALASQIGGRCHLISISQDDKGKVEQVYATQDPELENIALYEFGGLFTNKARYLLFGVVKGCLMVWDRQSGDIVHGLNHGEDQSIQAVSSFDGSQSAEAHVLTGTRQGQLCWFAQPPV